MVQTPPQVAFVGYRAGVQEAIVDELYVVFGAETALYQHTNEGLPAVAEGGLDLILVGEMAPSNGVDLGDVDFEDQPAVVARIVELIRAQAANETTPIVVPYIGLIDIGQIGGGKDTRGRTLEDQAQLYVDAGADLAINTHECDTPYQIIDQIRPLLTPSE
tara:strand:+ start:6260 stop:6742 length:483 start_codon:yes stop_codon:yes gene_type:complete